MSVQQIPDDFDDPQLEQAFQQAEAESHMLDPAKVVARARRRRRRHRILATGSAVLATAAVSATALVASSLNQAAEPPAAQQSAAPQPEVIPNDKWVKVSQNQWFKFTDGEGYLSDQPTNLVSDDVSNLPPEQRARAVERRNQHKGRLEEMRKQGWMRPDLSSGTPGTSKIGGPVKGTTVRSSIYIGADVRRVVVSVTGDYGDFRYDARVFRLAGLPGWVLAHAEFPPPSPVDPVHGAVGAMLVKIDAYGADGQRLLRCGYTPAPDDPVALKSWKLCEKG